MEKRDYRIIVNGCDEVFNEECLESEASAKFYEVIAERKYQWLELRLGQADEEDKVIDSAWTAGQSWDSRYVYVHELHDATVRAEFPEVIQDLIESYRDGIAEARAS